MIRKAQAADIFAVMAIISASLPILRAAGNPQWDETYPAQADFAADIAAGNLYLWEAEGAVLGVICVNQEEPAEYGPLPWSLSGPATVVHRMAVSPASRGRGVGGALLDFADEAASASGTRYLKSDTYGLNQPMNRLLIRHGYRPVGTMRFKGKEGLFNCYEKALPPR